MPTTTARSALRSVALPAAVLAAAALGLTACSASPSSAPSASLASSAPSASSGGSAAGSGSSAGSGASAGGAAGTASRQTGTGAGRGSDPALPACASGQLSVAQTNQDVGAGQYYSTLVFTNTSGRTCTLTGYPGVSYVAAGGVQSGNAATRSGGSVVTVTLRAGGKASAQLHDSNGIGGYDPAQCRLSPAQGLRIYPPDQRAALFLPWKTEHCAGPTVHAFTIGPVQAG